MVLSNQDKGYMPAPCTIGWSLFPKFRPGTVRHSYDMTFDIRKCPEKEFLKDVEN